MQKVNTYPRLKPVSTTGKVNAADAKVNAADAQSRLSGISFAQANGKLCFALLTSFSAAQNNLPRSLSAGGGMHSEVVHPVENIRYGTGSLHRFTTKIQQR